MSIHTYLADMAHAALLSAGHVVTRGLRSHLDRHAIAAGSIPIHRMELVRAAAREILDKTGFQTRTDVAGIYDLLPDVTNEHNYGPRAGHAVRLTGNWSGVKAGGIVILSGSRHFTTKGFTVGVGRHFWDGTDDAPVNLSSGGPASILALNRDALTRTDETTPVMFWKWRSYSQANGGIDYRRHMPLWEWDGDEAAFISEAAEKAVVA